MTSTNKSSENTEQNNPSEINNRSLEIIQKRREKEIKVIGKFFYVFGILKIIAGAGLVLFMGESISNFGYTDSALNIVIGTLWVILGLRIKKSVDTDTLTYLRIIFWVLISSAIIGFLAKVSEGGHFGYMISVFMAIYVNNGIKDLKNPLLKKEPIKYKLNGWKWVWFVLFGILLIFGGFMFDTKGSFSEPKTISTDKSSNLSEITGNMYRNTKYHFRIKFPEGSEIKQGDGAHIAQKAVFGNSTISLIIQQLDLGGNTGFSSIKDAGTLKEVIDTSLEGVGSKFSDVTIIDSGETKIDNEPAYWVEYSAGYQVLDQQINATNLVYFLAKGDTFYSISSGTLTKDYSSIKPLFLQTVSSFVFE